MISEVKPSFYFHFEVIFLLLTENNRFVLVVLFLLLLFFAAPVRLFAAESAGSIDVTVQVSEIFGDLDGDGVGDIVRLMGLRQPHLPAGFYDSFYLEVLLGANNGKVDRYHIPNYVRGTEPVVQLAEFQRDGPQDLFISVKTQAQGRMAAMVARIENNTAHLIFNSNRDRMPTLTGRYQDGYVALVRINETGESTTLPVREWQNGDFSDALYMADGKLRNSVELQGIYYSELNIAHEPGGEDRILAVVQVAAVDSAVPIAEIEALLSYRGGRWSVISALIKPLEN